jgi:hypothetical protein
MVCQFMIKGMFQTARQARDLQRERLQRESDHKMVLADMKVAKPDTDPSSDGGKLHERVQAYAQQRKQRTETFLTNLYAKREEYLAKLQPPVTVASANS